MTLAKRKKANKEKRQRQNNRKVEDYRKLQEKQRKERVMSGMPADVFALHRALGGR